MKIVFHLSSDEFRQIFLEAERAISDQLCGAILMSLPQEHFRYAKFITKIEMGNVRAQLRDIADSIAHIEFTSEDAARFIADPDKLPARDLEEWNNLILSRGKDLIALFDDELSQEELVAETREKTDALRLAYAAIDRDELRTHYVNIMARSFCLIAKEVYVSICQCASSYVMRFDKK